MESENQRSDQMTCKILYLLFGMEIIVVRGLGEWKARNENRDGH